MNHADTHAQPVPTPGGQSVTDAVVADLQFRREQGTKKYGQELLTNNGRDALVDAYQEAMDLVVYLKQALMEREATSADVDGCGVKIVVGRGKYWEAQDYCRLAPGHEGKHLGTLLAWNDGDGE